MDFMAMLNGLPSLCYTSALDKVLPVGRQNVKDPTECGKINTLHSSNHSRADVLCLIGVYSSAN